ncbi:hypothetical protein LTR37_012058 [Vermiconidia calcicola]|uniref:Uncharacterized protein n=1 Tax=Vermiconidia calcicola TaxID=1690605 RepID=A0ACC3N1I8_9PEZI|nr:hypothetical protein LTR37_012058 [Vermiconidia calcicola]
MKLSTSFNALALASRALAAHIPRQSNDTGYSVQEPPLTTPWTYEVGTDPWPEYPRPLFQRPQWQSLNGIWRHQNYSSIQAVNSPPVGQTLQNAVMVPSCLESGLSGLQGEYMFYNWYSTSFTVPQSWTGDRVLLNFGAVDYEATVVVNGQEAGFNRGGYHAFSLDITELLTSGTNELLVFAHDPTDSDPFVIPIGKQTLRPSHIFYRPCSGIWQSVWIESAPANYVTELNLNADMDGKVSGAISTSTNTSTSVEMIFTLRGGSGGASTHGASTGDFSFTVESPALWSLDSPNLYDIEITVGQDKFKSYTGFRTVSRGVIDGIERPLLNGEFVFLFGTLDQGYWPDGLYVPPNYEAMVYDLKTLKQIGYNGLRKHIKVETDLFYKACDEMGLFLIQDMPSLRPLQERTLADCTVETIEPNAAQQAEFQRQLELLIQQHRNYPSILIWVIYNEGWGQITEPYYPEFALTDIVEGLDPSRLVIATSGWYDHGAGDFSDNHHYANPQCGSPFYSIQSSPYDPSRIGIQGEFGGIGQNTTIEHLWNVQEAINAINQTYEIDETRDAWNYRAHRLLGELEDQVEMYACSGGIWTQTTDVEGEVNGMLTYDRRVLRPDLAQWNADINALYDAAAARSNSSMRLL